MSLTTTQITLASVPRSVFPTDLQNVTGAFLEGAQMLASVSIPPGIATGTAQFAVPTSTEPLVVFTVGQNTEINLQVTAILTILP